MPNSNILKQTIHQKPLYESGINTDKIKRILRKYWYIFLIFSIIMTFFAYFFLRYQTPDYTVKSSILIKDDKTKQGISAADLLSKEFGLNDNKKLLVDESQVMTSYSVMEDVTKSLKLDRSVYVDNFLMKKEIYGDDSPIVIADFTLIDDDEDFNASLVVSDDKHFELTFRDGTSQSCTFGRKINNKYGTFLIYKEEAIKYADEKKFYIYCKGIENATRQVMRSVEIVLPRKESNIFDALIKSPTPQKAKDILHKMVAIYNQQSLSNNSEVSQNTLKFIEKRLMSLTGELTGVEHKVETYKTQEGMTPDGTSDINYLFNRLGEYDSELVRLGVQNSILSSIETILVKNQTIFELLPTNLELKSVGLQNQIAEYNKLVLEHNKLMKAAGESNPNLKIITDDLKNLRTAIIENINRVKQDNNTLLAKIESKNALFSNKLSNTPRRERELTEIKRNQNIKEGLYLFLLQKQEEMAMSIVGATPNARVIDKPLLGDSPATLNKPFIYLFSIFISFILAALYVTFKVLNEKKVQSEADIIAQTRMPILAKIPYTKSKVNWVITNKSRTAVSEMFRILRANLQFYLPETNEGKQGQVILVTSTMSGEGKSFVTLNLGMSFAIANKKTVIIGLDLRRPKISEDFSILSDTKGVTDYLVSDISPDDIIQKSEKHENLFFISSGFIPDNPSELIMSAKMGELLMYLRQHFAYIVIDTPPVGLVSDALFLKQHTDMTLYIVRFDYTEKVQLGIINGFFEEKKLTKPTLLFNGLKWDDKMSAKYSNRYYSRDKKYTKSK